MIKFIKNKLLSNTGMLIRLDDIAENMNWQFMDECEILFDKYNIKPLLGVIPNNEDKELLLLPKNAKFWNCRNFWSKNSLGWLSEKFSSNLLPSSRICNLKYLKKSYDNLRSHDSIFPKNVGSPTRQTCPGMEGEFVKNKL